MGLPPSPLSADVLYEWSLTDTWKKEWFGWAIAGHRRRMLELDAHVRDGESTQQQHRPRCPDRGPSPVSSRCRSKQCLTKQSTAIAHTHARYWTSPRVSRSLLASYTENRRAGDVLSKHNRERKWGLKRRGSRSGGENLCQSSSLPSSPSPCSSAQRHGAKEIREFITQQHPRSV